jgi:peptidoglycan/xylan/chitin deacetylase (PgdA/CDA1 family)
MRIFLRLIGLLLLAGGLAACAAQPLLSAEQLASPTYTFTPLPPATDTPTVAPATPTPTRTSPPTVTPIPTVTMEPTVTETPAPLEPTAVLTPIPFGPPAPDGVARRADAPILMYHYISESPSAKDRIRYGLSVPPEIFEAQLKLLQDNGYTTITLRDLYNHLAIGTPLPDNPIILTFDDGYVDNYTNAFPILQKYGMIGTFFVLTGPADEGDPTYLTWDMIQEMSNSGMDIQLHSRAHLDMRNRAYDWLVFQIVGGRQSIEGHTGKPVNFIAYPSGKYDANLQRFLRDANFWAAVTTAAGRQHTLQDALVWDRVRIAGQFRLVDFAKLLGLSLTAQRVIPRPTSTSTATDLPDDAGAPPQPTPTPTRTLIPRSATPSLTHVPASTPGGPPATQTPSRTPFSSPLVTPTVMQSPLITPTR